MRFILLDAALNRKMFAYLGIISRDLFISIKAMSSVSLLYVDVTSLKIGDGTNCSLPD